MENKLPLNGEKHQKKGKFVKGSPGPKQIVGSFCIINLNQVPLGPLPAEGTNFNE